jgi:hypothetical protein
MKNMKKYRLGVIGLGNRGAYQAACCAEMDDAEVVAVCDLREDKLRGAAARVAEKQGFAPRTYTDSASLLEKEQNNIDGVIISTSWETHVPIALDAMRRGIPAGIEVGGVSSLEEANALVKTHEKTGVFCMLLQNANYGREELSLLNMVKQGKFGELIHLQCGYQHDLREGLARSAERGHYRLAHFLGRNCDNYPHHGLGPMMKLLKINRGNRFVSLVSVSSKAAGIKSWAKANLPPEHHIHGRTINQGDIVNTVIKCANGETVLITLDNTLPRPYSRAGRVQGTKGLWMEDNKSVHIEGESPAHEWESFDGYLEKTGLEHPLWKSDEQKALAGKGFDGHGGIDRLVLRSFIEDGIGKNLPPFDTYDSAVLSAITPLTEMSIALGGAPVAIPDYTSGRWLNPRPAADTKYSLDI